MAQPALSPSENELIQDAAVFFTNPGALAKSLSWIGRPIEAAHDKLPARVKTAIGAASEKAIKKALQAALVSLPKEELRSSTPQASMKSSWLHQGAATAAGAVGGLLGLVALPVELPLTTVLILRGILDQARLHGHDIHDTETRLECLLIFSLGTPNRADDAANSAYFATRIAFSQLVQKLAGTATGLSAKEILLSLKSGASPLLAKLIQQVAEAFQIRVTQKFIAESVPIAGAVGGGLLNYAFCEFFVKAAKYHFALRALEKKHGLEFIQGRLQEQMNLQATKA
ncbi:MAG: EcsC family protein [Bdellovibrionales bacterium]